MNRHNLQPYPGLRAFERYESRIFFGRQQQVDDLLTRLKEHHFLAVLGASGSGKSSLVKAGLLPGLEKGYMGEVGSRWVIAEMRPGDQPFQRLAEGLLGDKVFAASQTPLPSLPPQGGKGQEVLPSDAVSSSSLPAPLAGEGSGMGEEAAPAALAAELRRGSRSLHEILAHAPLPSGTRLLLLVDQFEEMFRYRKQAENQAAAFVALLLEACQHPDVYVVITMRSDFLGAAAEFHGLPEAINHGLYLTPRMTREELREAISLPAQLFGGEVDEALTNHLLNEAGNDPDQLPLLQHALMGLYKKDKNLTLERYQQLQGLKGTLNSHAERTLNRLDDEGKRIAEILFRALTERGSDGQNVRRLVKAQEILDLADCDLTNLTLVVDTFRKSGRNFLMPPPHVPLTPDTTLDISHESLMRQWERLKGWVDDETDKAEMFRRLLDAAERHQEKQGELWHGTDLALVLEWRRRAQPDSVWAQRYSSSLPAPLAGEGSGMGGKATEHSSFDLAMKFLADSEEAEKRQVEAEEARRKAELGGYVGSSCMRSWVS